MKVRLVFVLATMIFALSAGLLLRADQVAMQNGDRYIGRVLSVSTNAVLLESENLGKISVPRKNIASISFGTNVMAPKVAGEAGQVAAPTNHSAPAPTASLAKTRVDLSAALRELGANTNFIHQVREQMLIGSPEAAGKYDELVGGLLSGKLNLNDLQREATSSAKQLRTLKRDLGPEGGEALDGYLQVLDVFLKGIATEPADATGVPPSKPAND